MPITQYCTTSDVWHRLSTEGANLRVDDDPGTLQEVLDDAAVLVNEHCELRYSVAQLAVSDWVRKRAADVAAALLCERRGNPVPVGMARKFDRTTARLEQIRLGTFLIPDIGLRKTEVPVLSNVRVRLDPFPRTVVERNRSTGKPEGYTQHADRFEYLDYSI